MLRWVETASTAQARRRRVQQTVDHLLGKSAPVRRSAARRPRWTCPRCGNQFVTRNMYHSCKRYELSTLFTGKARQVRELFDRVRTMVERLGSVKMLPYRDKVGFMVRVRFAGAIPRKGWLDVAFSLRRRIEHPRFHRVETPATHLYIVRVTEPSQLDRELAAWIREAYTIGCQQEAAATRGIRPGVPA
jgi:uncharacterized protein DUF5655